MEKEVLSLNPSWLEWPAKQWSQILDKIICLKEMYTQGNIIVEILRWRPLFFWWRSAWAIKERWTMIDLSVVVLCSAITET